MSNKTEPPPLLELHLSGLERVNVSLFFPYALTATRPGATANKEPKKCEIWQNTRGHIKYSRKATVFQADKERESSERAWPEVTKAVGNGARAQSFGVWVEKKQQQQQQQMA